MTSGPEQVRDWNSTVRGGRTTSIPAAVVRYSDGNDDTEAARKLGCVDCRLWSLEPVQPSVLGKGEVSVCAWVAVAWVRCSGVAILRRLTYLHLSRSYISYIIFISYHLFVQIDNHIDMIIWHGSWTGQRGTKCTNSWPTYTVIIKHASWHSKNTA